LRNGLKTASCAKPCSSAGGTTRRRRKLFWSGSRKNLQSDAHAGLFPLHPSSRHKSAHAPRVALSMPSRTHGPPILWFFVFWHQWYAYGRFSVVSFSRRAQRHCHDLQSAPTHAFHVALRQVSAFFFRHSAASGPFLFPCGSSLLSLGGTSFPGPPLLADGEHPGPPSKESPQSVPSFRAAPPPLR
jgi:hypothetical protein